MSTHDDLRLSLGAYALGTLEPADQHLVEAHLAGCPACLTELAELAAVVPAMARLTPGDLAPPQPSPDLFARIASAVDDAEAAEQVTPIRPDRRMSGGRYRSRRWLVAVAAGVAVIAGGTGVGIALVNSSHPSSTASASAGSVHLRVTATDAQGGSRLVLVAKGLKMHEHCHLVAVAADGSHHDAGTWDASYEGAARVVESTDVPRSDLRRLLLFGGGRQLLAVDI